MKKSALEIYALAACFALLMVFLVRLSILSNSLLRVVAPAYMLNSYRYEPYRTDEKYLDYLRTQRREIPTDVAAKRKEDWARVIEDERRDGVQGIVRDLPLLLFAAVAFVFHWVVAKKARAVS